MNNWKEKKLKEIAIEITDGSHNPPEKVSSGYPMFSGRNLVDGKLDFSNPSRYVDKAGYIKENKRTNIQAGDVFLSIVGSIGLTAVVPEKFEPFVIQRSIALIRTNEDSNFIRYYFESPKFQEYLTTEAKGAAQKGIYLNTLRESPIRIPPLDIQKKIVIKLDNLFEKISKSILLLEENLIHSKSLMGSILDEVFTKLEHTSKVVKISKIANIKGGKRLPKGEQLQDKKTDFPYIRVTDFNDNGSLDVDGIKYMSKEIQSKISRYIITSDDLYISIAGTIGKTGIIPKELDGANLTENAARFVYKDKKNISNKFVYYYTKSDMFKAFVAEATKQVAQPKLALTRLNEIELALPSITEQEKAVEKFIKMEDLLFKMEKEIQIKLDNMKALKSSLLDHAFKEEL